MGGPDLVAETPALSPLDFTHCYVGNSNLKDWKSVPEDHDHQDGNHRKVNPAQDSDGGQHDCMSLKNQK
jgi:hypothetical protein